MGPSFFVITTLATVANCNCNEAILWDYVFWPLSNYNFFRFSMKIKWNKIENYSNTRTQHIWKKLKHKNIIKITHPEQKEVIRG